MQHHPGTTRGLDADAVQAHHGCPLGGALLQGAAGAEWLHGCDDSGVCLHGLAFWGELGGGDNLNHRRLYVDFGFSYKEQKISD